MAADKSRSADAYSGSRGSVRSCRYSRSRSLPSSEDDTTGPEESRSPRPAGAPTATARVPPRRKAAENPISPRAAKEEQSSSRSHSPGPLARSVGNQRPPAHRPSPPPLRRSRRATQSPQRAPTKKQKQQNTTRRLPSSRSGSPAPSRRRHQLRAEQRPDTRSRSPRDTYKELGQHKGRARLVPRSRAPDRRPALRNPSQCPTRDPPPILPEQEQEIIHPWRRNKGHTSKSAAVRHLPVRSRSTIGPPGGPYRPTVGLPPRAPKHDTAIPPEVGAISTRPTTSTVKGTAAPKQPDWPKMVESAVSAAVTPLVKALQQQMQPPSR